MDYLELLKQDMQDFDAARQSRAVRLGTESYQNNVSFLDLIDCNLREISVILSVSTTLMNSACRDSQRIEIVKVTLRRFLQRKLSSTLRDIFGTSATPTEIISKLLELDSRLDFALRLTDAWLEEISQHDNIIVSCEALADAWRCSCRAAIAALDIISDYNTEFISTHDPILEILHDSMIGGEPCLDELAQLQMPGWAERRIETRVKRTESVIVATSDIRLTGLTVDISRNGVQLKLPNQLAVGQRIVISIVDVDYGATVRWRSAHYLGATWDVTLPATHWLIQLNC